MSEHDEMQQTWSAMTRRMAEAICLEVGESVENWQNYRGHVRAVINACNIPADLADQWISREIEQSKAT